MLKKLFKKRPDVLDFPVAWGGYYTFKEPEDGMYHAWRLLDFNVDVLHYRPLDGKYDHKPSLVEVQTLRPLMHIPQAATTLLRQKDLTYLGNEPLTKTDLEGYKVYPQDACAYSELEADEFIDKVAGFSHEGVGKIRLRRNPQNPQSFVKA
jgi:hypothetical protein